VAVLGVVIYTADERPFKQGKYVEMFGELTTSPTTPDLTCILHTNKFTEKDAIEWHPLIAHRLVIVTDKKPRLTKKSDEFVILHSSLDKEAKDYYRATSVVFRVRDRALALSQAAEVPLPLLLSFVRANRPDDMELHRALNDVVYTLPQEYAHALVACGIKPTGKTIAYPKKSKKDSEPPAPFRSTDQHWQIIVDNAPAIRNEVRDNNDEMPKGVKKTKEAVSEWI
jgi:hypothetical protein